MYEKNFTYTLHGFGGGALTPPLPQLFQFSLMVCNISITQKLLIRPLKIEFGPCSSNFCSPIKPKIQKTQKKKNDAKKDLKKNPSDGPYIKPMAPKS